MPLRHIEPELSFYAYFERREKFIYDVETYEEWTIFAVEEGSFYYDLNGETGTAAFGDLLFCKPGVPIRRVVVAPLTFHYFRFRWQDTSLERAVPDDASIPSGKISLRDTGRLADNYARLREVRQSQSRANAMLHRHYAHDIWLVCAQQLEPPSEEDRGMAPSEQMRRAASLIRQRAYGMCSMRDLAAELHISPYQLSRAFKAAHGSTPMQYLGNLRLERAKMLLIETELTLSQIAECCGYDTGFYVNKLFRKHMGMTPAEFRGSHRV